MEEARVRVNDGKLFYRLEGRGEPLVLLNSLGVSSESWRHVMKPLAKKFSVYAVDLMGHGNSDKPNKNYEISDYAESVVEFMDALGISKGMIMSNSIGAAIALDMSTSFPQRVVKQVLVGCPTWEKSAPTPLPVRRQP